MASWRDHWGSKVVPSGFNPLGVIELTGGRVGALFQDVSGIFIGNSGRLERIGKSAGQLLGSKTSDKKALAAMENGKLGGRGKKRNV